MLTRCRLHLQKKLKSLEAQEASLRTRLQQVTGGKGGGAPEMGVPSEVPPWRPPVEPLVWRRAGATTAAPVSSDSLSSGLSSDEEGASGGALATRGLREASGGAVPAAAYRGRHSVAQAGT